MKLNQKGFETLTVVGLLLISILVGGIGWYVWSKRDTASNQDKSTIVVNKKTDETPKLSDYKNEELGISLKYPAEWGATNIVDGPLLKFQSGKYKQLSFSKASNATINFVIGPYSSPLDACGYDDPVQNAQHEQNANQASLIGWTTNNIKQYMSGSGYSGPTVYEQEKIPDNTGPSYTEISKNDKVLIYQDVKKYPITASNNNDICSPITQTQADAANAFAKFFHYAVNFSNSKVYGVNGQFDARNGDDLTVRSQLSEVLNSIQ